MTTGHEFHMALYELGLLDDLSLERAIPGFIEFARQHIRDRGPNCPPDTIGMAAPAH